MKVKRIQFFSILKQLMNTVVTNTVYTVLYPTLVVVFQDDLI